MDNGWLELESDPGLFTLLLEDFGVQGVQIEEIYDLQKSFEGDVYGFIFLFRWIEERRSRRKIIQEAESLVMDDDIVNKMFFAQQMIPNSCATHALLSVLLNTDQRVKLGPTLSHLKIFSKKMSPEDKGYAIGNLPELSKAHNSHARPEVPQRKEKQQGISVRTMEAFHFVSYVPINGRLYELDGLKPYPIDHGPIAENDPWTEKFRTVITERLGMATGGEPYHDIRFNLMAVVPDRKLQFEVKLKTLKTNRQIVLEALQQMVKVTNPDVSPNSAKNLLSHKSEPVMTRSVAAAAREALANHQAEKDAAANDYSYLDEKESSELADSLAMPKPRRSNRKTSPPTGSAHATVQNYSPTRSTGSPLPPGLDCHSYAKSPVLCGQGEDLEEGSIESEQRPNLQSASTPRQESVLNTAGGHKLPISQLMVDGNELTPIKNNSVKIEISVSDESEEKILMPTTVATTDVTKPLTIQTKFAGTVSPGPSSESTDTASEVASLLNSPAGSSTNTTVSAHSSPNTSSLLRQLIHRPDADQTPEKVVVGQDELLKVKADLDAGNVHKPLEVSCEPKRDPKAEFKPDEKISPRTAKSKFTSSQGFTPKDLLSLLKNVENEIEVTEQNLKDEVDKKKKFRIDDCRRTHNYDQFICTFLSMLAEQGHLAGLVEQHLSTKKRQNVSNSSLHKKKTPDKRAKGSAKKKKR